MRFVIVHGAPGVGKFTVASKLVSRTGYRLLHYHALGALFGPLLGYGSPHFIEMRDRFYPEVVRAAVRSGLSGVISTFIFEPTVPLDALTDLWEDVSADLFFIGLTCTEDEHRRRVENRERGSLGGINDFELLAGMLRQGTFTFPDLPGPAITIDTTHLSPGAIVNIVMAALPEQWGIA
jgi:predicted kinase